MVFCPYSNRSSAAAGTASNGFVKAWLRVYFFAFGSAFC